MMIKIVGVIKNTLTKDIRVKPVTNVGVSDEDVVLEVWGTYHCLSNLSVVFVSCDHVSDLIKQPVQALKRNGDPIGTVLQFVAKLIEGLLKRKQIDEGRGMA